VVEPVCVLSTERSAGERVTRVICGRGAGLAVVARVRVRVMGMEMVTVKVKA